MFDQIKAHLFSIPGIVTTFIHVFLVVGFVTCYMAFQTQVLGNDPLAQVQQVKPKK
jgi:hypothetical protein